MAKYGMSQCALGMSEEFRDDGVAVNTLWPRTGNKLSLLCWKAMSHELVQKTFCCVMKQ